MKKKRTKGGHEPERRGRGEIPESARKLRELYERGMAELEERRKIDPNAR